MPIPVSLTQAAEALLASAGRENYEQAVARAPSLSLRYRQANLRPASGPVAADHADALAYLLTRMPATFCAFDAALAYTLATMHAPENIKTLLDVGAGTGAAAWAADGRLSLDAVTCLEYAPFMRQIGATLMREGSEALQKARWLAADLTTRMDIRADLVSAAYVLNELPAQKRLDAARRLFASAKIVLILVEPGTPDGFNLLRTIRNALVEEGAYVLAPCPHAQPCPLPAPDWCHFTVRVPRNRAHKRAKAGDAPFEDEKFTYLALSRSPAETQPARVLRHPMRYKGHVRLDLCTENGLRTETITRASGECYALARKAQSGDAFTVPAGNNSIPDLYNRI